MTSIPTYSYTDGVVTREEWRTSITYNLHRVDGPALQVWEVVDGQRVLTSEEWLLEGRYHRMDGPAHRTWQVVNNHAHSVLTQDNWLLEGKYHRMDGPAVREWTIVNGLPILTQEEWWLQDKMHRVGAPAFREWKIVTGVGVLTCEFWWLEDKLHRVDGPACLEWKLVDGLPVLILDEWSRDGRIPYNYWYLHGTPIPSALLPSIALRLQRWYRHHRQRRWSLIQAHLRASGLLIWPGLLQLIRSY